MSSKQLGTNKTEKSAWAGKISFDYVPKIIFGMVEKFISANFWKTLFFWKR